MSKILKNFKNIKYGPAPEDDKEAIAWINKLSSPNKNYIDGKWASSKSSKKIQVINPSNKKKLINLSVSSKKDVNSAVNAAWSIVHGIACLIASKTISDEEVDGYINGKLFDEISAIWAVGVSKPSIYRL